MLAGRRAGQNASVQLDHSGRSFARSNENNSSTHGQTVSPIAAESESNVGPGVYGANVTYLKLSPSKAASWVDCPRRYFLTYVERRRSGQTWAHFSFGNSVHAALREWFELPVDQRTSQAVDVLIRQVWIDSGFRDREQSDQWRVRATDMVSAYVRQLDPTFQPFSTERTLAFKAEHFIMQGRIDRIDLTQGRASVVDYKTGKSIPSPGDVRGSQALAMYALMLQRALGHACLEVSLHHLPSGNQVTWTHTDESLKRHLDRVTQIAQDITLAQDTYESNTPDSNTPDSNTPDSNTPGSNTPGSNTPDAGDSSQERDLMLDELFPARPSALCGFCDFWSDCAVGQSFTRRKEPWEGLSAQVD